MSSASPAPASSPSLASRFKAPRHLSLRRSGKFFLLMTLAVGFGAINTGNNLLFLLLGMMLSVIVASGILSEAVIRHLRPRRRLPRRVEAGRPAPGQFTVHNQGSWPALSVEVSEQNPRVLKGLDQGAVVGPESISWWKFWRQQTDDERRPLAASYRLRFDADSESPLPTHYELPTRGLYRLFGPQLKTRFPFGFFEKTRTFDDPIELTVLPAPLPARQWLSDIAHHIGDESTDRRGRGDEFYGLRDYRPGEDRRAIHWKSTARLGEPVIRESEARQRRQIALIFDTRLHRDTPASRRRFEWGLRHLAGLLQSLQRRGFDTRLLTSNSEHAAPSELLLQLKTLATIQALPPDAPAPAMTPSSGWEPFYVGFQRHIPSGQGHPGFAFDALDLPDPSQLSTADAELAHE